MTNHPSSAPRSLPWRARLAICLAVLTGRIDSVINAMNRETRRAMEKRQRRAAR